MHSLIANFGNKKYLSAANPLSSRSLHPAFPWNVSWQLNLRRTVPNCPQLTPAIALPILPTMSRYRLIRHISRQRTSVYYWMLPRPLPINPVNTLFNPIYHLLALLVANYVLHVSRIRVNYDVHSRSHTRVMTSILEIDTPVPKFSCHVTPLRAIQIQPDTVRSLTTCVLKIKFSTALPSIPRSPLSFCTQTFIRMYPF
jgi:hypothetical protein